MKSGMRLLLVAAAVAIAGLANACSRDGDAPQVLAGPHIAGEITEGARLRGHLTRSLQLMGPGGAVRAESSATEPFDVRVQHGVAAVADHGALVALTQVKAAARRPLSFTDSEGHRHEIEFESGANGEPPRAVRAAVDGRPLARTEYTWQHSGRGYVLAHRSTTLFGRDGSPVLREDVATDVRELASGGTARRALAALSGRLGAAVLPVQLDASPVEALLCYTEQIFYAFAALAVSVAWENLTHTAWNPKSWVVMGAAIKLWSGALDDLLACWVS